MPQQGATNQVRSFASRQYVEPARRRGERIVRIQSGEINRSLVEARALLPNRFPIVCQALKSKIFLQQNRMKLREIQGPPSGLSSTVTFVYDLDDIDSGAASNAPATASRFAALQGRLRKTYKSLGGAEAFHKQERAAWNERN